MDREIHHSWVEELLRGSTRRSIPSHAWQQICQSSVVGHRNACPIDEPIEVLDTLAPGVRRRFCVLCKCHQARERMLEEASTTYPSAEQEHPTVQNLYEENRKLFQSR